MLLLVVIFSANIIIMANESLNESVSQSAGFKMRKFAITINQTTTTIGHAECLLFELPRGRERDIVEKLCRFAVNQRAWLALNWLGLVSYSS